MKKIANRQGNSLENRTIASFGREWQRFDQKALNPKEAQSIFDDYFRIFPWATLPESAIGFDIGCGSGRWAQFVSRRVWELHCVEPSESIEVARRNLAACHNVVFHNDTVENVNLENASFDFGYSLGVLHHVADTEGAVRRCVGFLRVGAPLLLYLYYNFENRSFVYIVLWKCSNVLRRFICNLPEALKSLCTDLIAIFCYWPVSRVSFLLEKFGFGVDHFPLSYYKKCSLYTLRTDARDRFGTPLEKRFCREEIKSMLERVGLERVSFSDFAPYWCVISYKRGARSL